VARFARMCPRAFTCSQLNIPDPIVVGPFE
jgi:hypothetical protein